MGGQGYLGSKKGGSVPVCPVVNLDGLFSVPDAVDIQVVEVFFVRTK